MFFRLSVGSQLLPLILVRQSLAQSGPGVYSLDAVPTATCIGSSGQGTATYSTVHSLPTSIDQLNLYSDSKNGYAGQAGAKWTILTDTPGYTFSSIGVPGTGAGFGSSDDPANTLKKELKINSGNTSINFAIPSDSSLFDRNILIVIAPPVGNKGTKKIRKLRPRASPTSTSVIASKATSKSTYNITITATWPCSLEPGVAANLTVNPAPSAVATACLTNQISDSPDAWVQYGVDAYLTSLIAQATNSPSHPDLPIGGLPGGPLKSPDLDIGSTLTKDAAGPNECTVSDLCELTQCSLIRGQGTVDKSDPARFLAFNAYATLSNVLYEFWRALKFANVEEINNQDQFVNTFYQGTPPAITFQQIIGTTSPWLSLAATISGLIPGLGKLGSVIWIGSSILSEINAQNSISTRAPALEEKWEKSADLGTAIQEYVQNMTSIVESMYTDLISNVYGPNYLNYSSGGSFFELKNNSDNYASTIIKNTADTFYLKALDWVLKQNAVFIIFVPFGPPFVEYDSSGYKTPYPIVHNFSTGFSQQDCESTYQKGDNGTIFTICDAGTEHKGMARIYQITSKVKASTYTSAITGWDSGFQLPGGWTFNLPDVMRGAVNSFETGGFNFDLDNFPAKNITALFGSLLGNATQPGSFTIPVCSIAEIYTVPPNDGQWHNTYNAMSKFPDASTGYTSFDHFTTFDACVSALNYKNSTTGQMPDQYSYFINSGLVSDLLGAMDTSHGPQ